MPSTPELGPIVTAATVAALPRGAVLVHVGVGPDGPARYAAGHLPDAVYLDRDAATAGPVMAGTGRHPLPSPEVFAAALGAVGVGVDDAVLATDADDGASAARLVLLLRALGASAGLLEGGLAAWTDPLETGPPPAVVPVARPPIAWPPEVRVGPDDVARHVADGGLVLDARSAARFAGREEPLDPVAGHIPGAVSAPYTDNYDRHGVIRSAPALHARYAALGADAETIVYCGSGVTACVDALAIEHAELGRPRVYIGSWSHWITDPERPVATGDD